MTVHAQKQITITCDDFGMGTYIDSAIWDIAQAGRLNSIEVMANYPGAVERAAAFHREFPSVAIGVHLNVTCGPSLLDSALIPSLIDPEDKSFYVLDDFIPLMEQVDTLELRAELEQQIQCLLKAGVQLDHLTSQQNILSLYRPFFEVLLSLAKKYKLGLRKTIPISLEMKKDFGYCGALKVGKKSAKRFIFRHPFNAIRNFGKISPKSREKGELQMKADGIPFPDRLCVNIFFNPTRENLDLILGHIPRGELVELVFHPGYQQHGNIPKGVIPELFPFREQEAELLLSNDFDTLLSKHKITVHPFPKAN